MNTKHIIIGLVILLVILFFVGKKEHITSKTQVNPQDLSNEAIQNIASIYADSTRTASFNNLNVTGRFNMIPTGVIVAFNGTVAPRGWAICDGTTQGVPDLRSRFIIGTGQGNSLTNRQLGDKGGVEDVTLTLDQIPAHTHDHNIWRSGDDDCGSGNVFDCGEGGAKSDVTISNAGGGKAHDNMPPFYALMYIMKL